MKIIIIISALVTSSISSSRSRNSLLENYLKSNQNLRNIVGANDAENVDDVVNSGRRTNNNIIDCNDTNNDEVNRSERRGASYANYPNHYQSKKLLLDNHLSYNENRRAGNNAQNLDYNVNFRKTQNNYFHSNLHLTSNYINDDRNARWENKRHHRFYNLDHQSYEDDDNDNDPILENLTNYYDTLDRNAVRSHDENSLLCMCAPSHPKICGDDGHIYDGICQFNCGLNLNSSLRIIGTIPCPISLRRNRNIIQSLSEI